LQIVYTVCERLLKLAKKGELLHIPLTDTVSATLESAPLAICDSTLETGEDEQDSVLDPKLPATHHTLEHKNGIHGQGKLYIIYYSGIYDKISLY